MKAAFLGLFLSLSSLHCDVIAAPAALFRTKVEFIYQTNGIREVRAEDWGEKRPIIEVGEDFTWNWGAISEGIEMGTRFTKSAYAPRESIELEIRARNVSRQPSYFAGGGAPIDDFKITVNDDQNRLVPELRDLIPSSESDFQRQFRRSARLSNPKTFPLLPGTQHIYVVRLDELFDLSRPGKYFVSATLGVPKLDGSGYSEVSSGTAMAALPGNTNRISRPNGDASVSEQGNSSGQSGRVTNANSFGATTSNGFFGSGESNGQAQSGTKGIEESFAQEASKRKTILLLLLALILGGGSLFFFRGRRAR